MSTLTEIIETIRKQKSQARGRGRLKIIIAIDLATTRCCVATGKQSITKDPNQPVFELKNYECWTARYETGQKWPITALYYGQQRLPTTGNALEPIFRNPIPKAFNVDNYFRLWKLMFHDHQNDPMTKEIQEQTQKHLVRLGKTPQDLLHDWVEVTYKELILEGSDGLCSLKGTYGNFLKQDIEIVVTVPPGRSVVAHEQVHQAFIQGPIGKSQVFLVSEPEAMFRSWVNDGADPDDFKVNRVFLVADGGGGTCCLVRFRLERLEPLGFAQEYDSESLICGAETISSSFQKLAETVVHPNHPNRDWTLDRLRRQFDEYYKIYFGNDDERRPCAFQMPGASDQIIEFSYEHIAECFDQCIMKVVKAIQRQQNRGSRVEYLVLGGGLFSSPYVMKAIRKEFGSITVRELSADKGHVARGAVLVRSHAGLDFITTRPIHRSIAVVTWIEVTPKIKASKVYKDLDVRTSAHDKKEYFYAAQWLARRGYDAQNVYEIASEATFETARTRLFDFESRDLEFNEQIITVNFPPGNFPWVAFRKDGRLMERDGTLIPNPEKSELITWNPSKSTDDPEMPGIRLDELELKRPKGRRAYRTLRYSIQMQLKEVSTRYWIKAWSLEKQKVGRGKPKPRAWLSDPTEQQAIFTRQEISKSLYESFKLGSGLNKEEYSDQDVLNTLHEHREPDSGSSGLCRKSISSPGTETPRSNVPLAKSDPSFSNLSGVRRSILTPQGLISPLDEYRLAQTNSHAHSAQSLLAPPVPRPSPGPLTNIRPTQGQSIENGILYAVGARRNDGGCWTCHFRGVRCEQTSPQCFECTDLGLVCEYGRPHWWYDDELRTVHKDLNEELMQEHKTRIGHKKLTSGKANLASAVPDGPSTNLSAVNQRCAPTAQAMASAAKSRIQEHPLVDHLGSHLAASQSHQSPPASEPSELSQHFSNLKKVQGENEDLYGTSPPPRKKLRRPPKSSHASTLKPLQTADTKHWSRKSARPSIKPAQAANMINWADAKGDLLEN